MKRFCMSLCILALFSTALFAEKKSDKDAKLKQHQTIKKKNSSKQIPLFPCECPITEFPNYWIGEFHPEDSNCMSPEPKLFSGSGFIRGTCKSGTCTGCDCASAKPVPRLTKEIPLLDVPVPPSHEIHPRPVYHQFADPRFVKLKLEKQNITIHAKVYTVVVDVQQMADDHNRNPDHRERPWVIHPYRGAHQILIYGCESYPPSKDTIDPKYIKEFKSTDIIRENERECIVDFGLHKGIILLAKKHQ